MVSVQDKDLLSLVAAMESAGAESTRLGSLRRVGLASEVCSHVLAPGHVSHVPSSVANGH
jgi:hypothetical protein